MEKITYSTIVPLIGGMSFGAKKALDSKPSYILSYPPFAGNDKFFTDYWNDIPYHVLNHETNTLPDGVNLPHVDFVTTLCPCAGLSQLNNGKKRGANAPQNEWMYKSAEFVLENIKPRVLVGENAPGLFGPVGEPVLENLKTIAEKHNYSFSIIKTSTMLHGIPQNRIRTFYFFWDSSTAPILNWYNRDMITIEEYLSSVVNTPEELEEKTNELQTNALYLWFKSQHADWRSWMKTQGGSFMSVMINSKPAEYIEWVKANYPEHAKTAEHAIMKRSNGQGFWDSSPFLPVNCTGAFTGARMNAVHPIEDRVLTRRELMHFMGLPADMDLVGAEHMGKVFQNVPSNTSSDIIREVAKFIKGELEMSDVRFLKQDNISQKLEIKNKSVSLF